MGNALEEHYGYLSDAVRREKFERAVARAVKPGDTVADVGCGFGIFGLMALDAGASHVWGVDRSDAIEIARETMRRNGLAGRFTCLRETSFEAELPEKVDVVICDHVGYFGFDYGIIRLLDDARRRLSALTDRELEVARGVGKGQANAEIAAELYMSIATVKAHVGRALSKIGADNRVQLAILVHDAELG